MNKTIGILAHVDCGKTTFCEQLLYHTNAIRKRGRVDNKDTFLDNHDIEKQRGMSGSLLIGRKKPLCWRGDTRK